MKYLKLEEIANLDMGKTPARNNLEYWNGNNTWVSISDLKDKYISESKEKITDKAISDTKIKEVPKNTLIISFKLSIGKKAITTKKLFTNEAIMALKIKDENELDVEYLYYALEKVDLIRYTDKAAKGKTLNKEKLKKIEIPICDMYKQKKIVKSLNKVKMIISKKREQLESLENLKKSQFFELFGDPIKNEKGWEKVSMDEISRLIIRGKTPKYVMDSKIGIINQACIYWEKIKFENIKYHENNEKVLNLENQDVLINSTGTGTLGRVNIFTKDKENDKVYTIDTHVTLVRLKKEKVNSIYLKNFFRVPIVQEYLMSRCVNGSTNQIELSKEKFKKFRVLLPPLELQNKFATKIEAIQKLKFEIEKSLKETENLYNSLMQKFFSNK